MHSTPFRRAVALVLCCQPVFWMSNTALAQTLDEGRRGSGGSGVFGGFDTGSSRGGRSASEGDSPQSDLQAPAPLASPELPSMRPPATSGLQAGRAPQAPIDQPIDAERYVCGPGDVFDLNFWGLQNFMLRVTVDLEGRVFVPKLGSFAVQGKTLAETRRILREAATRSYPRLSFGVVLAEPRTFVVQLTSGVAKPGSQTARATDRVGTVIEKAGGFGPKASKRRVEIHRRDGTTVRADLLKYELTGNVQDNPFLLDGDVVRVPFEELAATIDGAVNRPGRYELVGSRDLAELVEVAGGLAPSVTRELPIRLVRRLPDDRQDQQLLPFAAEGLPASPIRHEDTVRIPGFADVQRSVTVIGAITGATTSEDPNATRRLPFAAGDTVQSVLDRAGGLGPLADFDGAYLQRGEQKLPLDLRALIMLRDLTADRPVELGDTVVVPFKRRSIRVAGAVFAPGYYPHNPDYSIEEYVGLAGGPNRSGRKVSAARIIGPNGEIRDYDRRLKLAPGSQIIIPERNFSPPEIVQILISAASVLVSGVAVVLAAKR